MIEESIGGTAMILKPIFTSTAASMTVEGDNRIPAPCSYGSVGLQWKHNGILVKNEASYPMLTEEGQVINARSESIIPWPEAGTEKNILVTTQDKSREIFSVHIFWTADSAGWNAFKRTLTNKGECYLSELSDNYRLVMTLSNGPLDEGTLNTVKHLLDELKTMHKEGLVSKELYDKTSHDWKSEMYPYYVRMIQKKGIREGLLEQCAAFLKNI